MAIFIDLLSSENKQDDLFAEIRDLKTLSITRKVYERDIATFSAIEDAAFLYSMPDPLLRLAAQRNTLSKLGADARQGIGAATRFHRLWWEVIPSTITRDGDRAWPFMAHGTPYSPFYKPSLFRFKWGVNGAEAKADICHRYPYLNGNYGFKIQAEEHYFEPGLCYGKRTINFSAQIMPANHVFSFEGTAIATRMSIVDPWILLGLLNSRPVSFWLSRVCAQHKAYNYLQGLPVPNSFDGELGKLARRGWERSRQMDMVNEVSNAFVLPEALLVRLRTFDRAKLLKEIEEIKVNIDSIAFDLYGFSGTEVQATYVESDPRAPAEVEDVVATEEDADEEDVSYPIDMTTGLLSWAVGVAFGSFDWRLATGDRTIPPEPDPFDPLPVKSPGMVPDGANRFHSHQGILVDEPGNKHDLARLIEEVLTRVDAPVPPDIRRWLQRELFPIHLQRYSKSRRKAPIYWPLATASGDYTLWLCYRDLHSQTLYIAINEFVEPKLEQVGKDLASLRSKGTARSRDEDKTMEALQTLERELVELRDTLLQIAPTYRPNTDDGVQITAAPLWPLFRHKPWQKLLKETWAKLEKGDCDWSHLAMAYYPGRVREKCKTDKSLAIAHGLGTLYEPPPASGTEPGSRGRKRRGAAP